MIEEKDDSFSPKEEFHWASWPWQLQILFHQLVGWRCLFHWLFLILKTQISKKSQLLFVLLTIVLKYGKWWPKAVCFTYSCNHYLNTICIPLFSHKNAIFQSTLYKYCICIFFFAIFWNLKLYNMFFLSHLYRNSRQVILWLVFK